MKAKWHVIFWVLIVVILSISFTPTYSSLQESFYFVSMLLPVVIATSYFFNYFLIPTYLLTKRYRLFVVYLIYTLVVSIYLEMWVITFSFIVLAEYQYNNMSPVSSNIFVLAVTQYFIVLVFSFILLIRRIFSRENNLKELEEKDRLDEIKHISVRVNRQMFQLPINDIQYIESMNDYVRIHIENEKPIVTKEKISELNKMLPDSFIRIHRSFIINQTKLNTYNKEAVVVGGKSLPMSRTYKKSTWELLQTHRS